MFHKHVIFTAGVPPGETLTFEVELVMFNDPHAIRQAFAMLDENDDDVLDQDEVSIPEWGWGGDGGRGI